MLLATRAWNEIGGDSGLTNSGEYPKNAGQRKRQKVIMPRITFYAYSKPARKKETQCVRSLWQAATNAYPGTVCIDL